MKHPSLKTKRGKARRKYCIERSKQIREYCDGGNAVATWFYRQSDGKPLGSKDLKPVRLPVGQAASLATLFRRLPKS